MAADFGFRRCPIFRTKILAMQEEEVVFSKLWCWTKDAPHNPGSKQKAVSETPRCPRPCRVNSTYRAHRVDVVKKANKCHGSRNPSCELVEMAETAAQRELSTISTRLRAW